MKVVTVATKLTKSEDELLRKLAREYGFLSKGEAMRNAVRLYLNLLSLRSDDRLKVLQLINDMIAPSRKSSEELMEEVHEEEDKF